MYLYLMISLMKSTYNFCIVVSACVCYTTNIICTYIHKEREFTFIDCCIGVFKNLSAYDTQLGFSFLFDALYTCKHIV